MELLLVEDNDEVRDSMVRALELVGHTVLTATGAGGARERLAAAAHYGPGLDVVLLDWDYGADGCALDVLPYIPASVRLVVVLSGLDRTREVAASGHRCDYVLVKGASSAAQLDALLAAHAGAGA